MQNRHGELTIICKAKDLVNHTLQLTNNTKLFPKKVRFTLCQRMQNLSIQILHDIIAANEIYSRTVAEMNTRLVRSPNSSNANNVRYVNSDGSLNNNNAYNGNRGVRPASVEYRDRVTRKGESRSPPSKEDVSGPGLTGQG